MSRGGRSRKSVGTFKLALNPLLCNGHGICTLVAKDLIALDRWGYPAVLVDELAQGEVGTARRAVRSCPARALSLIEVTVPTKRANDMGASN